MTADNTRRLRSSEAMLRGGLRLMHGIADRLPALILYRDAVGRFEFLNQTAEEWLAVQFEIVRGKTPSEAGIPEHCLGPPATLPFRGEVTIAYPDGRSRVVDLTRVADIDANGTWLGEAMLAIDVSERKTLEAQMWQAQKMEAIGTLTGGIAHDLNNLLGVIIGNLDLLKRIVEANPMAAELCEEARSGAQRGGDLIKRLLAFAQMQPLQPELLDVNALIEKTTDLLRHVLGRDIVLDTVLAEHLWPILADPTQLEASFLNLASNAHDAMPQGGNLLISTRNVVVDHAYQERHPDAVPGAYTLIQFCDTGTGIAPENMDRIFEPFFTTKTVGKGTGLGLSMIFGFVRQSGGHLSVDSVPGMSTTIRLFLPRHERQMDAAVSHAQKIDVKGGPERVLVVEDNEQLRHATARKLTDLGYDVRVAEQADTALDILDHWCPVDLLFTDVVMPGRIDGIELAKRATQSQRCSKVLVTSGFAGVRDGLSRLTDSAFPFLGKPYRHDELARAVRRVLDETGVMASGRCSTAGL